MNLNLSCNLRPLYVKRLDVKTLRCKTTDCKTIKKIEEQLDVEKLGARPLVVKP